MSARAEHRRTARVAAKAAQPGPAEYPGIGRAQLRSDARHDRFHRQHRTLLRALGFRFDPVTGAFVDERTAPGLSASWSRYHRAIALRHNRERRRLIAAATRRVSSAD